VVSPPFELAASEPLTRRQLLGASLGASAAVVAASAGLPTAAKAFETGAPGLSAAQRADCLAIASRVASQEGVALSGVSPSEAVNALNDDYRRARQVYRDTVDAVLEPLEIGGRRYASLPLEEQNDFLRAEVFPAGGVTTRGAMLVNAVELVAHRLVSQEWEYGPGMLARSVAAGLA
jgi:hypothetical protein